MPSAAATQTTPQNGVHHEPEFKFEREAAQTEPGFRVIRRNGGVTPFDPSKISVALTKAFLAVEGSTGCRFASGS